MQPSENLYVHFVAILEQFKKGIRKNEQKLVPVAVVQPISPRLDVTSDPSGATF